MNNQIREGAVIKLYRLERYLYCHHFRLLSKFVCVLIRIIFNCVVPPTIIIGKGSSIAHGVGIVIHHEAVIGENVKIYQNVTIGHPRVIIGNNVLIGAGAVILGPCNIGNNVKIGANTVVNFDVPDNCTVVGGAKGRIIQHD